MKCTYCYNERKECVCDLIEDQMSESEEQDLLDSLHRTPRTFEYVE